MWYNNTKEVYVMIEEKSMAKEPKLFGQPQWDVEEAARTLSKARELEKSKPALYVAAIKYLEKQQKAVADVIRAAKKTKGKR